MNKTHSKRLRAILSSVICVVMLVSQFNFVLAEKSTEEEATVTVLEFIIDDANYTIDGVAEAMDTVPKIIEARTMLPIRYVATPLGADIDWDGDTRTVTIELDGKVISLQIDNSVAKINGIDTPIDPDNANVKPIIIDSRTFLPVRFVTESLGCEIEWDGERRAVTVTQRNEAIVKEDEGEEDSGSYAINPDLINPDFITDLKLNPNAPDLGIDLKIPPLLDKIEWDYLLDDFNDEEVNWLSAEVGQPVSVTKSEAEIPVVMRIGRGYNVFGTYASVDSLKQVVLDHNRLIADGKLERMRLDQAVNRKITSRSILEYSRALSEELDVNIGIASIFGGMISDNFSSSSRSKLNNYFSTYMYLVKKYNVYVKGGTDYKLYLTDEARTMINDEDTSPGRVLNTFGHYVLVDAISGGRIDYSVTVDSEKVESFSEFQRNVNSDFDLMLFNGGLRTSSKESTSETSYNENKEETLNTYGGDVALSLGQFNDQSNVLVNWESSLEENSTFVEFGKTTERALVPIWELADSTSRSDALKAEFERQETEYRQSLPQEEYVLNIYVVSSSSPEKARALCPPGYTLINIDLNKGAGGKYMYLCYLKGTNPDMALTDFFMEHRGGSKGQQTLELTHNGNLQEYTRLAIDLNKSAGGKYVYLWYTMGSETDPVKDMGVFIDKVPEDEGWEPIYWQNTYHAADVNYKAGGAYIYIAVKR